MSDRTGVNAAERAVFWIARVLACMILMFWGFFIVAHLTGNAGAASRELVSRDYIAIASMVVSLVGLGVAFKWEKFGATLTLFAVAIGAIVNWRIFMSPVVMIPVAGVFFLIHGYWWPKTRTRLVAR